MAEILSIGELLDLGGSASTAGLIPYSALEYSAQKITAISGTAIGGNVDSATVTAIVNSSVSGKVDQSAFDQCCSSMSSVVSSLETSVTSMSSVVSGLTGDYLEKTASSMFQPSGDYAYSSSLSSYLPGSASSQFSPSGDYAFNSALSAYQPSGDYAFNSSVSSKLDESAFTAYTATATQGHTYTGVDPIVVDNANDRISLSATPVQLDGTMTSYMSGGTGFIGVNGNITSQMTSFVKTGDMSGYIPTSESAKYQLTADMSSYATTAQLADKLDTSAQAVSAVQMLNNDVRYINGKDINAAKASLASSANKYIYQRDNLGYLSSEDISALRNSALDLYSAKLDASANLVSSLGTRTEGVYPYVDYINGMAIYANRAYSASTADFAHTAGYCKSAFIDTGTYVPFSAFALESSVSSKLDASASSDFLAASASSDFYSTANESGFTNYLPNFGYNADDEISGIDGSAVAGGWNYTSPSGTVAIDNANGTLEIWNSAIVVTEHVTAGQTSYLGSSDDDFYDIYRSGVGKPAIPAGTNILYMVQLLSPIGYGDSAYSLEIRFTGDGDQRYVVSSTDVHFPSAGGYTGSAMFSSDMNISTLSFRIAGSSYSLPTASASVSASSIVYGQTAYETSVQELALASQVPSMSAWQSLTAWAVAQGWTP